MKLLIEYKNGNKAVINFKTIECADEYIKSQAIIIKSFKILEE